MIEHTILAQLVYNEPYTRRVLPFLKPDYFHNPVDRQVFDLADEYIKKYNSLPTREALLIELGNIDNLPETIHQGSQQLISHLGSEESNLEWLIDQTEEFCQDKAYYNALMKCVELMEKSKKKGRGVGPDILQQALAVSFDSNIGHDYFEDAESRYEYYHRIEEKLPFDVELFNLITKGGVSPKTLNIILAGTHVGKSLVMCHMAAHNLMDGKNVLYITLEMSEEEISKRIDTNLLNVTFDELDGLDQDTYLKKVGRVRAKTAGKLKVVEFPTASAGVNHFRHLINELKLKSNFVPDIIYVDYLNICISSRLKAGSAENSYLYMKNVAEEFRGLAVELNVPIWTATQTNRGGFGKSDLGLDDTSESFGLPMTADLMIALVTSEELEALGQLKVLNLKNRYAGTQKWKRFVIGIDRDKMRLYNVEQEAQDLTESSMTEDEEKALFDTTGFGEKENERERKERYKTLFGG